MVSLEMYIFHNEDRFECDKFQLESCRSRSDLYFGAKKIDKVQPGTELELFKVPDFSIFGGSFSILNEAKRPV